MTFISYTYLIMGLYGDKFSTTKNRTFKVTKLAWTRRITSPRETVDAPLKLIKMWSRFSKAELEYLICL